MRRDIIIITTFSTFLFHSCLDLRLRWSLFHVHRITIASVLAEFYVDEYQNELKALTVNSIRWGSLQQTVFV